MQKKVWIALLLLLIAGRSVAQKNCRCAVLNTQQFDELVSSNDSSRIYRKINQLRSETDKNCELMALDIEIAYLTAKKNLLSIPSLLTTQEKLTGSTSCKQEWLINYYLNYANYCKVAQDYEGLSKYAFLAMEDAETRHDKTNELKAITNIVHLFTRQQQEEKNWAYVKKAEEIITGLPEDYSVAINYNWLAFEYERKFTLTERMTLMDSAMLFATRAKAIALAYHNYAEVTRSFRVFESYAYNKGNFKMAISYIDSAIFYSKKIKTPINPSALYFAKAWDYMDLSDFEEAERWQDTSIYYAEKYEGRTPATMTIYGEAAKLYEAAGNLHKTINTLKIYQHIKDSVFKMERSEKINELEQKYNKAKNEKTIKELAQQRRIYLLLALAGLLGAVAIAFFLRQQSLKHKKNILETEQRLNRARMNPHFFFNALTTLQKFALRENDGQAMAINLSRFSNIMRETLESTYKEYVTIEQEIEFLNEYLDIQKIRFPQTFSYEVRFDKSLDIDELLIPAMIIQPFVENSIEHGFAAVHYPGRVLVDFSIANKELQIEIADNGKGLATGAKENNEHISRASQIIKDRIYLLNIKLKTKAGFIIDNNSSGGGVLVKIHLPLLYKDQNNTQTA